MSALTLLIWERWDFSSSRSSSSRCAFFMASMAAWDSTALPPSTAPPKGIFFEFLFVRFLKEQNPSHPSKPPTASRPPQSVPLAAKQQRDSANPAF